MAFAFPVFTKLLHIQAPQARLLTYAIQGIGMSAAYLTILYMRDRLHGVSCVAAQPGLSP
jgi:hypothetical protein